MKEEEKVQVVPAAEQESEIQEEGRINRRPAARARESEAAGFSRLGGIDVQGALFAGLIAGLVFLILEMALMPLLGMSALAPLHMIGAIVLGPEVLPPAAMTAGIFLTALVVHFVLSILYAFILGAFINQRTTGSAVMAGLVFGLVLYVVNFYVFTGFFAWFAEARNWVSVVAHLVFGATAALVYVQVEARAISSTLEEKVA